MSTTVDTTTEIRPFQIETETGTESFDSVIFANIREMAKYAVLSEEGRPDDGRFEVIILRHTAKWRVLATAVRAALFGLGPQPTAREYRFRTRTIFDDGTATEYTPWETSRSRDLNVTVANPGGLDLEISGASLNWDLVRGVKATLMPRSANGLPSRPAGA